MIKLPNQSGPQKHTQWQLGAGFQVREVTLVPQALGHAPTLKQA